MIHTTIGLPAGDLVKVNQVNSRTDDMLGQFQSIQKRIYSQALTSLQQ